MSQPPADARRASRPVPAFALALCALVAAPACGQSPPAKPAAAPPASAAKPAAAASAKPVSEVRTADARAKIAAELEVPVDAVKPSAVPGLYEVVHEAEVLYVSTDGRYVIAGDLYDLGTKANLSEQKRAAARRAALAALTDREVIAFGPKDAKHVIDVFTDIDCGFCRKMHGEVAEYNKLGIRVRYLAYPRGGPGSDSWQKAVSAWCAPNRQDALTRAKAGEALPERNCKDAPVSRTWELGRELQVRGTPAVYTERGEYVSGYMPPARMLERLVELEAQARTAN